MHIIILFTVCVCVWCMWCVVSGCEMGYHVHCLCGGPDKLDWAKIMTHDLGMLMCIVPDVVIPLGCVYL